MAQRRVDTGVDLYEGREKGDWDNTGKCSKNESALARNLRISGRADARASFVPGSERTNINRNYRLQPRGVEPWMRGQKRVDTEVDP
jgi:hypothetical protein